MRAGGSGPGNPRIPRPPQQELSLAGVAGHAGGALELGAGLGEAAKLVQQVAAHAGQQVVLRQRGLGEKRIHQFQAGLGAEGHPDRDRAVLVANAVTFDLIGINKAIRNIGNEDDAEARRWFDTLVDDIRDFVSLEPRGPRPPPEG